MARQTPGRRGVEPGISGFYATADDRFVQLHTNFPHHLQRTLDVLGVPGEREQVAAAVATWPAVDLEEALARAGACATRGPDPDRVART